jgi:hypothetical protein
MSVNMPAATIEPMTSNPFGEAVSAILQRRLRPASQADRAMRWLWQGYLAAGKVTLLTSQWKSGKTTLMAVLLARLAQDGQLAGLATSAARAAVLSEEGQDDWARRCRRVGITSDHVSLFCRPFDSKPTMVEWRGLVAAMLELQRTEGLDLLVIDPLAVFLPGNGENLAGVMTEWLLLLRALTDRGVAVLILHHPRKGKTRAGQAARGSGALASHVDIVIEMHWYARAESDDRRRWLRAYSRFEETPRHLVLELTPAGNDYLAHEADVEEIGSECRRLLLAVLEEASEPLTQRQILAHWPEDAPRPDPGTISRALKRGLDQGLIQRQGSGRKNDLYRYWLVEACSAGEEGLGASDVGT